MLTDGSLEGAYSKLHSQFGGGFVCIGAAALQRQKIIIEFQRHTVSLEFFIRIKIRTSEATVLSS